MDLQMGCGSSYNNQFSCAFPFQNLNRFELFLNKT